MGKRSSRLQRVVAKLVGYYGDPRPWSRDPWHLILRENVVYLQSEEARDEAFARLKQLTGLEAETIAACPDELLLEVCGHGKLAPQQVAKLRECAELFATVGDPRELVRLGGKQARRQLQRFPGIGAPGAEKLLLLAQREAVLALDSNGLRVLLRLGYGTEAKSYSTSYRSAQTAAMAELPGKIAELVPVHLALQRHGREICRNTAPACPQCKVRGECPSSTA